MNNQMIRVSREDPNLTMRKMTINETQAQDRRSAIVNPPIEYVTNNGFRLVRLSELHPSPVAPDNKCHFMVQPPGGEEREVSVDFDAGVIAQLQSQRHRRLSESSDFWVTLAEQHLATYLWKNNRLPAGERLVVSQLSSHDLALAASWRD